MGLLFGRGARQTVMWVTSASDISFNLGSYGAEILERARVSPCPCLRERIASTTASPKLCS